MGCLSNSLSDEGMTNISIEDRYKKGCRNESNVLVRSIRFPQLVIKLFDTPHKRIDDTKSCLIHTRTACFKKYPAKRSRENAGTVGHNNLRGE